MIEDNAVNDVFPTGPIDRFVAPIQRFLKVETTSGVVLIAVTIISLLWANLSNSTYTAVWETPFDISFAGWSLSGCLSHTPNLHWLVNDALMTIFFFSVGLEVKGEMVHGELRDIKAASLPILAALGGMIFPAIIYSILTPPEASHGWGIPMATDIAFVVGCMALLGSKIPHGLRVMILTLAIADDIGSIIVVALGYSGNLNWFALGIAFALLALTWLSFRAGIRNLFIHGVLAVLIWFAFVQSGVHAALAGVALGLLTPVAPWVDRSKLDNLIVRVGAFINSEKRLDKNIRCEIYNTLQKSSKEGISLQDRLNDELHPWVSYVIMPLFALANAGVLLHLDSFNGVTSSVAIGLIAGKPIGVFVFSLIAVKCGISRLPTGVTWKVLLGGGMLAGIGFTMSLFVAGLAFVDPAHEMFLASSKIGILLGSILSAVVGTLFLSFAGVKKTEELEKSKSF